jgi:hypothetical protein
MHGRFPFVLCAVGTWEVAADNDDRRWRLIYEAWAVTANGGKDGLDGRLRREAYGLPADFELWTSGGAGVVFKKKRIFCFFLEEGESFGEDVRKKKISRRE